MEPSLECFVSASCCILVVIIWKLWLSKKSPKGRTPPSPPSLPFIGHIHLLKNSLHRTLTDLGAKYGPVYSLSFGSRPVLVLSSPSAVQQCFTEHDVVFANRPRFMAGKYLNYNDTTLSAANYGSHWRNLRRMATIEVFSAKRLNLFRGVRQEEVKDMLKSMFRDSASGTVKIELKPRVRAMLFNMIMRMLTGKRYYGDYVEDVEEAKRVKDVIQESIEVCEVSHPGDFVPFLKWLDFGRMERKMIALEKEMNNVFDGLLKDLRAKKMKGEAKIKTMVDVLFELQETEPEVYPDDIIKGLILTLIGGATDTSTVIIEWAMASLINNPSILKKAREEIETQIGQDRLVTEEDLPNLPYLQAIIKETLRLYPSLPVLVPHESSEDCIVEGYHVKKGTMLVTNAWAMHRDPELWDDPTSFKPERFQGLEGEASKLVPFGLGRRGCPGNVLAMKIMGLCLGSLIQCFDWESEGELDMSEGTGLTIPKAEPLEAICRARESMIHLLSEF